jgi:hypothetical protein
MRTPNSGSSAKEPDSPLTITPAEPGFLRVNPGAGDPTLSRAKSDRKQQKPQRSPIG